eukprot:g6705.t1 g6705   contig23:1061029-1062153(-)
MAKSNINRRGKQSKPTSDDAPANPASPKPAKKKDVNEMTTWEIFTTHPLIYVGKFIIIPYILYLSYYFILLQHPEYLPLNLRPSIIGSSASPRQLLVVASPGSGTVQMASELRNSLHLEVGHESTDAAWHFVRDGTVSWFHGIRFLTQPNTQEGLLKSFTSICNTGSANLGFHPAMYGPSKHKCSYRSKWDDCWQKECYRILIEEWGCGVKDSCEIKFANNIHQVRNPMRTLESLVVKFCVGGLEGSIADKFLTYASALFPQHDFVQDSCIEAAGYFLVMYQEAMIDARARGEISSFYRIEESSACDVAELAGLTSSDTTVYQPNYSKIKRMCDEGNALSPARKVVKQQMNKVNKWTRYIWDGRIYEGVCMEAR